VYFVCVSVSVCDHVAKGAGWCVNDSFARRARFLFVNVVLLLLYMCCNVLQCDAVSLIACCWFNPFMCCFK